MACSRVFWNDNPDKVVGRTLDWPPARRLPVVYAFRASHARRRDAKPGELAFKIQHRVMGVFDKGATEGIYDRGLAAHLLYLDDAKFETRDAKRSGVGFWLWAQYYLDNFKTVREALAGQKQVQIVKTAFGPYQDGMPVHLALSSSSTVTPWCIWGNATSCGTITELPGGIQATERFVRAAYALKYLPKTDDAAKPVAYLLSVMNNVSVPFGSPYIGVSGTYPTWWRCVIELSNRIYAVQTTVTPNVLWVDIAKLNTVAGAKPR